MKKLIVVAACLSFTAVGYAAQPNAIGNVKAKRVAWDSYTLAQINALTADTTNQWVGCSNCTRTTVCVSSGSHPSNSVGAFVIPVATGPFVGSTYSGFAHCQ